MTRTLLAVAAVSLLACSSPSSKPPLLVTGPGQGGTPCELGGSCPASTFCVALADSGCPYLQCNDGIWSCVPDGGPALDAAQPVDAAGPVDAGGP